MAALDDPSGAAPGAPQRRGRGFAPRYPTWLTAPSFLTYLALFVGPLAILALFAFSLQDPNRFGAIIYTFDLSNFRDVADSLYIDVFEKTLAMAALGTALTVLVGYPVAYWMARYLRERKGLMLLLLLLPFFTSFLIRTYAWFIILDPQSWFARTLGMQGWLNSYKAVGIGLVYNYLPLLVLPVYSSLERMDWSLIEAANDLGTKPFAAFRQVTLPLTAPGLITGGLLVFIPMTGEYVIPNLLGGGTTPFVGSVVGDQFLGAQNYPFGSAMALALMGVLTMFVVLYVFFATREEQFGS